MTNEWIKTLSSFGTVILQADMRCFTTFACGGPAEILLIPNSAESLAKFLMSSLNMEKPITLIGGGSNILVGDKGINGITVAVRETDSATGVMEEREPELIYAEAMVRKSRFLNFCIEKSLAGAEFMAGIPGCIGGGIAMNAGTSDGTFSDILEAVLLASPEDGLIFKKPEELSPSYRRFTIPEGSAVAGGLFRLHKGDRELLKSKASEALVQRKAKHPLEYPSAGSVFKNPEGYFAWKLIRDAGLGGKQIGGAMVSNKHTNFIVNKGGASASDVSALIRFVQKTVEDRFSIFLEPEIKLVGGF